MTISEIILNGDKSGAVLIRYRKDSIKAGTAQYDVKPLFTGSKRGWTMLDHTTMCAMRAVYKALTTDAARAKFDRLPLSTLVEFSWKHVR
jgi:hypothetical protein